MAWSTIPGTIPYQQTTKTSKIFLKHALTITRSLNYGRLFALTLRILLVQGFIVQKQQSIQHFCNHIISVWGSGAPFSFLQVVKSASEPSCMILKLMSYFLWWKMNHYIFICELSCFFSNFTFHLNWSFSPFLSPNLPYLDCVLEIYTLGLPHKIFPQISFKVSLHGCICLFIFSPLCAVSPTCTHPS